MADIKIKDLGQALQIADEAEFAYTQLNGSSNTTYKAPMTQIAGKVAEGVTYANLSTTAKNLVGAINEVAQSGGGGIKSVTFDVTASHPINPALYSIVVEVDGVTVFSKDYSCSQWGEFGATTAQFVYNGTTYDTVAQGFRASTNQKMLDFSINNKTQSVLCTQQNSSYATSDEFSLIVKSGSIDASDIFYDNTTSGLQAENVQDALDEIVALISSITQ